MINNFALIIGAMKCGTTSLFSYLSQHPEVCECTKKEPGFFSRSFSLDFDTYQRLWRWKPEKHKIALEASTDYSRLKNFPQTIDNIIDFTQKYNVKFKFIYIVRNPIERIESHYMHGLAQGWFEKISDSQYPVNRHLIETTRYAKQIGEYYRRFSPKDLLVIRFEDIKSQPVQLMSNICSFLDVDTSFEFGSLGVSHNSNKHRVIDDPLWRSMKSFRALRSLSKLIPVEQKQRLHSLFGNKIDSEFHLSSEQREFILTELHDDLVTLSSEYNVDISRWPVEV